MFKKILTLTGLIGLISFFAVSAYASGLSVRLEQPKSPTNQNNLNLTFVTLDTEGRAETVNCFKKAPEEGLFTQFGTLNLAAGGNSGSCPSFTMQDQGTYQFYVTAQAGADNATSQTVSVEYKTSGPSTPENYSKEKNGCEYKIKFKTADDGGKTSKVEIYRSDIKSFGLDDTTKVGTIGIGSNQEGSFADTPSDCGKNYYFAIRAFDSAGNGSGAVGDSEVHIVNPTASSTPTTVSSAGANSGIGALPIASSNITPQNTATEGGVLGEQSSPQASSATEVVSENDSSFKSQRSSSTPWILGGLFVLFALGIYYFFFKSRKQ